MSKENDLYMKRDGESGERLSEKSRAFFLQTNKAQAYHSESWNSNT